MPRNMQYVGGDGDRVMSKFHRNLVTALHEVRIPGSAVSQDHYAVSQGISLKEIF